MKVEKMRLDKLMVERGLCESRERARALILAGKVVVGEHRVDKAGSQIPKDASVRLKAPPMRYVSRGGLKLEAALVAFGLESSMEGWNALDLGASTGGFTDCLLQHGCRHVTAVDVGYGQLHPRLRMEPRVHCLERTNARYLTREQLTLGQEESFDLIVADLSFISLRLVLEPLIPLLGAQGQMLLLVKPQFEAGRQAISKGGVVKDDSVRQQCAERVIEDASCWGLYEKGRIDSPVHGPKGNVEILLWLGRRQGPDSPPPASTKALEVP